MPNVTIKNNSSYTIEIQCKSPEGDRNWGSSHRISKGATKEVHALSFFERHPYIEVRFINDATKAVFHTEGFQSNFSTSVHEVSDDGVTLEYFIPHDPDGAGGGKIGGFYSDKKSWSIPKPTPVQKRSAELLEDEENKKKKAQKELRRLEREAQEELRKMKLAHELEKKQWEEDFQASKQKTLQWQQHLEILLKEDKVTVEKHEKSIQKKAEILLGRLNALKTQIAQERVMAENIAALITQGEKAYQKYDFDNAVKSFNQVLTYRSNDGWALAGIGQVYLAQNKYFDAIKTFQKALSNDTDGSLSWVKDCVIIAEKGLIHQKELLAQTRFNNHHFRHIVDLEVKLKKIDAALSLVGAVIDSTERTYYEALLRREKASTQAQIELRIQRARNRFEFHHFDKEPDLQKRQHKVQDALGSANELTDGIEQSHYITLLNQEIKKVKEQMMKEAEAEAEAEEALALITSMSKSKQQPQRHARDLVRVK